jgi:aryl-alcohol dehydrogenase-like predicted oxidoreductase
MISQRRERGGERTVNKLVWLSPAEPRIGLGCMRLSTSGDVDDERALATIAAAADAGATVFDTARAYGDNESLLSRALVGRNVRIVTKGGMARPAGRWVADGRARTLRADCEASLEALGGLGIDLYLAHAPDPRVPWRTTVRALARLTDEGLVRRVGVSNVNLAQLDEALALAPIAAVENPLSAFDDSALRSGVLERCEEHGLTLIAHSPLGGPRRVRRLPTSIEEALGSLLALSPSVVAIPGARTPEAARAALAAAHREVEPVSRTRAAATEGDREVVLVMGIPGAGKSRLAATFSEYLRLNRDARGGTLRALAEELDRELAAGASRVVLDNTYLTRVERSRVVDAAARHGARVRCLWLDTPVAQAQVNLVGRILERFGGDLPSPDELRRASRREAGILAPTSQLRAVRELEEPSFDEGFAELERLSFVRKRGPGGAGILVAASVLAVPGWEALLAGLAPGRPHLLFDWRPAAAADVLTVDAARLEAVVGGHVEHAVCTHPGGPPICWCRPALPGLPLAFANRNGVELSRSILVGTTATHRALAATVGAQLASPSSASTSPSTAEK